MSDIIVTTPLSQRSIAAQEARNAIASGGGHYFRQLRNRPKRLQPGDRVFYVDGGYVRGFAIVDEIRGGAACCSTTGNQFSGWLVFMEASSWKWIRPVPMSGFQGYRYVTRELRDQVEILGGWLDPMPEAP